MSIDALRIINSNDETDSFDKCEIALELANRIPRCSHFELIQLLYEIIE